MAQTIRMCGTALCTAAVASALLGFVSGDKQTGRAMRTAVGGYLLLVLLSVFRNLDELDLVLPEFNEPQVTVAEQQADPVLARAEDELATRLEKTLREQGIPVFDVTVTMQQGKDGYVSCSAVSLALYDESQRERAAAIVQQACAVVPAMTGGCG